MYSLFFIFFFMEVTLFSHPVIWKGGHVLESRISNSMNELTYHHSFTPKWSLGVHGVEFQQGAGYVMGQANVLFKRWNLSKSQSNIYFFSGLGFKGDEASKLIKHVGVQVDWEDRRVYTHAHLHSYHTDKSRYFFQYRFGVAPYVAEFNAIHSWLIVQIDTQFLGEEQCTTLMPVIRVFKDNVLLEWGHNFNKKFIVKGMVHF